MPILTARERIGTEIGGRYRMNRILGEGGFSAVFAAEHMLTGRPVAVKVLHAHLVQTEQVSQRFLIEAQAMAKIRHPGIVQVLDAGREPDGTVFIALELLEGETLEASLHRAGRFGVHAAVHVATEVLDAVAAAHAHDIVHRDIKPANIFLARESAERTRAKLLDFGIAHVAPKAGGKLTSVGVILGTPEYMSPEQGVGGVIGAPADLWSIGIVLYEMLTGDVPWTADSPTALLMRVASEPLPDICERAPGLPEPLVPVITRALEKDPARRFASAAEMRVALAVALCDAHDDPTGEMARIVAGARRATRGIVTPTPGPSPRPRAPSNATVVAMPPPAASPAPAVPSTSMPPSPAARAYARTAEGARREFDFDGGGESLSLDLPAAPAAASERRRAGDGASHDAAEAPGSLAEIDLPLPLPPSGRASSPSPSPAAGNATADRSARVSAVPAVPPPPTVERTGPHRPPAIPARMSLTPQAAVMSGPPRQPAGHAAPLPRVPSSRVGLSVVAVVAAVVAAIGGAALVSLGRPATPQAPQDHEHDHDEDAVRAARALGHGDAAARLPALQARTLTQQFAVPVPFGIDPDSARMFARHMVVGPSRGERGYRTMASCARGAVYLFTGGDGLPAGSSPADIACESHDLALVHDLDGDGVDDVAAISRGRDGVVFLPSRALRAGRAVVLPGANGVVGGLRLNGEAVALVYVDGNGASGATQVVALEARSGATAWTAWGRAGFTRFGHPSELGLAVGPDVTGDGVDDVVVGMTVPSTTPPDNVPARPRCVDLLSGATGQPVWTEPYCQQRGGSQSVSLGPDVDGDGHGDVAVGTDVVRGADPRVVLLSGLDAHVLGRIASVTGAGARGFGWPVALGPDLDGDGGADLVVGSVGGEEIFVSVFGARDPRRVGVQQVPGDVGLPNVRLVVADGLAHGGGAALAVSSPADGLHVYSVAAAAP